VYFVGIAGRVPVGTGAASLDGFDGAGGGVAGTCDFGEAEPVSPGLLVVGGAEGDVAGGVPVPSCGVVPPGVCPGVPGDVPGGTSGFCVEGFWGLVTGGKFPLFLFAGAQEVKNITIVNKQNNFFIITPSFIN